MIDPNSTEARGELDPIIGDCLATPPAEWSPNVIGVMIERLDDALGHERKGMLEGVVTQLDMLMRYVLSRAPDTVLVALNDKGGDSAIKLAYLLGNLSFANEFASTVALRRPDDAFFAAFDDPATTLLVAYLLQGSYTRAEMMATGLERDFIVAKLVELTRLGIVDFRHRSGAGNQGESTEYFLTPAACAVATARRQSQAAPKTRNP